jgi:hypothetical protein
MFSYHSFFLLKDPADINETARRFSLPALSKNGVWPTVCQNSAAGALCTHDSYLCHAIRICHAFPVILGGSQVSALKGPLLVFPFQSSHNYSLIFLSSRVILTRVIFGRGSWAQIVPTLQNYLRRH